MIKLIFLFYEFYYEFSQFCLNELDYVNKIQLRDNVFL